MTVRVAVIGAGAGGHALAADLSQREHVVTLFSRSRAKVDHLQHARAIEIRGVLGVGHAPIARATTVMEEAISESELLVFPLPGMVQESYLIEALPFLRSHHALWLCPGAAGTLIAAGLLQSADASPLLFETMSLPHAARMVGPGSVAVTARTRVRCAAFPARRNPEALGLIKRLFGLEFPSAENVLDTAVNNVNYVIHPLPTLLNTGWIESRSGRFSLYGEGMTSSVQRAVYALDRERVNVAAALGLKKLGIDHLYDEFGSGPIWRESMGVAGDERVEERFLVEDVPVGLVLLASLGDEYGVETPLINATIELANVLCEEDFRASGRTVSKLGIAGMSPVAVREFLSRGH